MTKFQCHNDCIKVPREARAVVFGAAFVSISKKNLPYINIGSREAVGVMARLNAAYSVLSDAEQRRLYDAQILPERLAWEQYSTAFAGSGPAGTHDYGATAGMAEEAKRTRPAFLVERIRRYTTGANRRIAIAVLAAFVVSAIVTFRVVWKEEQSMLRLAQAVAIARPAEAAPDSVCPVTPQEAAETARAPKSASAAAGDATASHALPAAVADPSLAASLPQAAQAPHPSDAPATQSDYERLTEMLKSMGLGLHKLDSAPPASHARQPATPATPAKPAVPDQAALATNQGFAPGSRVQPANKPAPGDPVRLREEAARPAAADPARGGEVKTVVEAGRTAPLPASASVTATPRQAVIADVRACVPPAYPRSASINGETGTVQLALLVDSNGRVVESRVQKSSGIDELDKAARKALSQCRFKVEGSGGQGEPVWTALAYVFSLD
jgi:TonB family protein